MSQLLGGRLCCMSPQGSELTQLSALSASSNGALDTHTSRCTYISPDRGTMDKPWTPDNTVTAEVITDEVSRHLL